MESATTPPASQGVHINLAVGGAGVCGAAEAGAAVALIEAGYVIDNVAGTSAGSMLGAILAARMDPQKIRETTIGLNYPSFQQPANKIASFLVKIPVVGKWIAWSFLGGAYKLDTLRSTCDAFLQPLGSLSWGEHNARVAAGAAANLTIVSLNLNRGERAVFPAAYADELGIPADDRKISEAIGASVAIPTFFRPPRIKDSMGRDWIFSDGGTIDDVPYDVAQAMDPSLQTVAITVDHPRPYETIPKSGFLLGPKLLLRLVSVAGGAIAQQLEERADVVDRTITVPTLGVDGNNFALTAAQAQALFDSGYQTANRWIARDVLIRQQAAADAATAGAPTITPAHVARHARPTVVDGGLAA